MLVTNIIPRRVIYFRGHEEQKKSALITVICAQTTTIPTVDLECSLRTLANLYNLQVVRGNVLDGVLDLASSMSGPHRYYGYLNPFACYTLSLQDGHPLFFEQKNATLGEAKGLPLPENYLTLLERPVWLEGKSISKEKIDYYQLFEEREYVDGKSADSLFAYPGILECDVGKIHLQTLTDPQNYDLSSFKVQVVANDQPFAFTGISSYKHAQHRLRVITYNYGSNYVDNYLMQGSGHFLEKHEFIQSITPSSEDCGGFILLGRESEKDLELLAIQIPFGYTLLVEPFALHGDSGLIGTYIMSMTGNHVAMSTANTVYLKCAATSESVALLTPSSHAEQQKSLLLTSNQLSLSELKEKDTKLKAEIYQQLGWAKHFWLQPIPIVAPNQCLGWQKTLGSFLPQ